MASTVPQSKSSLHLNNISELTRFIFASEDADEMYSRLTKGVCVHSDWDISSIQVLDQKIGKAVPLVRYDNAHDISRTDFSGWDADISPVGKALSAGEPLVLVDAKTQADFPGYRDDAIQRGYHTVVVVPMEVKDEKRRQMVYSVASRSILAPTDADIDFLKCVAALSTIAIRKMRAIRKEQQDATRLRQIVDHITNSLSRTLDYEAAETLASALSGLFPSGWLAIDLTAGRMLYDHDNPPPLPIGDGRRIPDEFIAAALVVKDSFAPVEVKLRIDQTELPVMINALRIDDNHVGALFFFHSFEPSDNEKIAAQAGQLALCSLILRTFIEFKSRKATSRRLLGRLFSREWDNADDLLDEAHQLDFDLSRPCRILLLGGGDSGMIDDQAHSYFLRTTQQMLGPAISCVIDGRLAVLISHGVEQIGESEKSGFLNRIKSYLPWVPLLVLSDACDSYHDIADGYAVCVNTLEVGISMGASGWISSTTVGEFAALMATADISKMDQFLGNVTQPFFTMGEQKSKVALETVDAFLASGRRFQETADTLGIHVSTLRYRLEQLEARSGMQFSDPEVSFELALAIRLIKLRNSYKKEEK